MTDLLVKQAYLAGFVNPIGLIPAFFEPVFVRVPNGNEYYLQECDEYNKITRFVPGVEDDENVLRISPERRKRVGQEAIYAFCPGPNEDTVIADERTPLANRLEPEIGNYADRPGLLLEMLEFCGAVWGISEARNAAYRKIEQNVSTAAALAWRDTQIFLPLIQSAVTQLIHEQMRIKVRARIFPAPLVKLNQGGSSSLSVEIPSIIRKFQRQHHRDIVDLHVQKAMNDFEITHINVTTTEHLNKFIENYIENGDADSEILPEVIDNDLAQKIIEGKDEDFTLAFGGTVSGFGEKLAKVQSSKNLLRPAIQIFAEKSLLPDLRAKVEGRISKWINADIERLLAPLLTATDGAKSLSPQAQRVVRALIESSGVIERRRVPVDLRKLDQKERSNLRALGIRFGAFHIYFPSLLKPGSRKLAAQLYAIKTEMLDERLLEKLQRFASSGRTTIPREHGVASDLYRAIGYAPYSIYAMRVDILERIGDMIRAALSWSEGSQANKADGAVDGKHFKITLAMTSTAGLKAAGMAEVLLSLGYRRAGEIERRKSGTVTQVEHGDLDARAQDELWTPARSEDRRILMESRAEQPSRSAARQAKPRR